MHKYIKKILGSTNNKTILRTPNDEMKETIKIVKSLEDSAMLPEGASETIQNEAKEKKGGFPSMLLCTLGPSWHRKVLAVKGINRAGEGVIRAGYGNKKG